MRSKATLKPTFRRLSEKECRALLARHHVGRIAFVVRGRADIEPISYGFAGDHIVIRTAPGTKLQALRRNPWVAFEVDEVAGPFDWRSVVVHATVYRTDPVGSESDLRAYRRAVAQLRAFAPAALRPGDPAPFRDVVLRLYISEIAGRAASTRGRSGADKRMSGVRRRTPP